MSKGIQNKFLPVFFGVVSASALGLGYLAYSASRDASTEEAAYKEAKNDLDALERAPLSRTEDNAKKKEARVDKYLAQVDELHRILGEYQAAPAEALDPEAFQKKLQKFATDINKAAKDNNVALPDKFDFDMGKYLKEFAPNGDIARALGANLEALNFITTAALESGLRSVDSFSREDIAIEKGAPAGSGTAPKKATASKKPDAKQAAKAKPSLLEESDVIERQSVQMIVTGKHNSVTALLEALANTSPEKAPHLVTIRNLRIENEVKTGTLWTLEVKAEEIKPEGQDPYIVDAVYVLGNQAVRAYLDMDIVRLNDPKPSAGTSN